MVVMIRAVLLLAVEGWLCAARDGDRIRSDASDARVEAVV